jgi:hypothetical protein
MQVSLSTNSKEDYLEQTRIVCNWLERHFQLKAPLGTVGLMRNWMHCQHERWISVKVRQLRCLQLGYPIGCLKEDVKEGCSSTNTPSRHPDCVQSYRDSTSHSVDKFA